MICRLSANSSTSVSELQRLDLTTLTTLAEEVTERDARHAWTNLHEAIARVFDLLAVMRVEALALGGVKRHNLPKPVRMPRPDDEPAEPRTVTPGEAARLMMAS